MIIVLLIIVLIVAIVSAVVSISNLFQLIHQQELIQNMATQADLEQAVQDVKDGFTAAVGTITDATSAAADRVIAALQSGVDPTTQIAELEALKQTVTDAGAAEVDKLNAIAPATPSAE